MNERPTPETDGAAWPVEMVHQESNYESWVLTDFARKLEMERDEAREHCDANAKQLLETVNDRNSLGTQLDLLRDEFQRIAARIGESGLGDNPSLSSIADYCQRAQKDIAVRYTPIEERDRACERLTVVSLQLEDCKAQRDELLEALEESLALNENWVADAEPFDLEYYSEYRAVIAQSRAAIASVKGGKL